MISITCPNALIMASGKIHISMQPFWGKCSHLFGSNSNREWKWIYQYDSELKQQPAESAYKKVTCPEGKRLLCHTILRKAKL